MSSPTEFAPYAIQRCFDRLVDEAVGMHLELGGILGDAAHVYGYHRARAVLPADDYSVVDERDRDGNPWAAAALDITPHHPAGMHALTSRLLRANARGDERITRVVREFYGSVDGSTVVGYDLRTHEPASSDDSHLWHVHISFWRKYACRRELLARVADVLAGH